MQNLLAFLTRYYHWLLFIVLEVVSGLLLFKGNTYRGSVWVSSANAVTGQVNAWRSSVEQFFSLTDRDEQLTRRNIELEEQLHALRSQLALTSDSLSNGSAADTVDAPVVGSAAAFIADTVSTPLLSRYRHLPASIISSQLNRRDNLLTIDRGEADGLRPDMGVACGSGVVGVVYMTSRHYAIVIPLLNTHSRISCSIRGTNYFGYLAWRGGATNEAYMEDVPRHATVKKGQWVETSGFSAIFPPGLTIGRIIDVKNSADGLSYSLRLRLSTDFASLREVCVITDTTFYERSALLSAARDSLSVAP